MASKQDGLKRELIALLGNNGTAFSLSDFRVRVKKVSRPRKWTRTAAPHPTRKDSLTFSSWKPQGATSVYNPEAVPHESELTRLIAADRDIWAIDSDWPLDEIMYMLELWQAFDGRFFLVADRYNYQGKTRTVEQIKDCFYKCAQKSGAFRQSSVSKGFVNFNMEEAMLRKTLLASSLEKRTGDVEEADFLFSEYRRILAYQEKMIEERNALQDKLDLPVTPSNIHCFSGSHGLSYLSHSLLLSDKLKRKRQNPPQPQSEQPEKTHSRVHSESDHRKDKFSESSSNTKHGIGKVTKSHSGCSLRSVRCQFKGNATPKVLSLLSSLELASTVGMPTTETCSAFEVLQRQLHLVLDAKKMLDKLNHEIRTELARQPNS
ncbi:hypothetical protein BJ508DRAFT_306201 [Ascobolus immersus RN42]|uniref:SWR1-complex protein 4 n=1 Tax=Ascobolus immersus RN42 TaxID=1160509 RepID=A0A3N4I6V6_ASCIM|nr:hypothetical protein BJ508DRAFT_306201 [Ascobolus immersus RN42]